MKEMAGDWLVSSVDFGIRKPIVGCLTLHKPTVAESASCVVVLQRLSK